MKEMWLIIGEGGCIQGWCLTEEFAKRVVAADEFIQCMRVCTDGNL